MKITVDEERVFPTLGLVVKPGDSVEVPDEAFPGEQAPAPVVTSKKKIVEETVVNDGSAA